MDQLPGPPHTEKNQEGPDAFCHGTKGRLSKTPLDNQHGSYHSQQLHAPGSAAGRFTQPLRHPHLRGHSRGKGNGSREGRMGQGGRGTARGGERPMGTTADVGRGSKGRAANGHRPAGTAILQPQLSVGRWKYQPDHAERTTLLRPVPCAAPQTSQERCRKVYETGDLLLGRPSQFVQ